MFSSKDIIAVCVMTICLFGTYTLLKATFTRSAAGKIDVPLVTEGAPEAAGDAAEYKYDYSKLLEEKKPAEDLENRADTITQQEIEKTVIPKKYSELDLKIAATLGKTLPGEETKKDPPPSGEEFVVY